MLANDLPVKQCGKCFITKDHSFFSKNKNRKDGLQLYCKPCSSKLSVSTRDPDVYKKYQDSHREYSHLSSIKARAKKKGIPFNLTIEDISIPERCPILDIPLTRNYGNRAANHNSPSVDRIDPEKGYVKGNVIVISTLANRIKQDATFEEILKVGNFYAQLASKPKIKTNPEENL